jgi:hypothetical protein
MRIGRSQKGSHDPPNVCFKSIRRLAYSVSIRPWGGLQPHGPAIDLAFEHGFQGGRLLVTGSNQATHAEGQNNSSRIVTVEPNTGLVTPFSTGLPTGDHRPNRSRSRTVESTVLKQLREDLIVRATVALRLCADITNGSKHFMVDRFVRHGADAHVERLWADSNFPFDPGKGMIIVDAANVAWPALWVVNRCVQGLFPASHTGTNTQ